MTLIRIVCAIFAIVVVLTPPNVQAQNSEAAIFIEAEPVGAASDGVFNVSISVSPKATYDSPLGESSIGSVPIQISLPWYVDINTPQCIGDCERLPKVGTDNRIVSGVRAGTGTTGTIVFSMTITDDSYSAAGISVRAGASHSYLSVPITQPANRQVDEMGGVEVVSVVKSSESDVEFVIDIDVSLPLSGGFVAIVPSGLMVDTESGCVDTDTREPSDYGQACMAHIERQPNGDTWFQVILPNGIYSMRIYLTPETSFEDGNVEMSAGGRYFETEVVVVNVPDDFQSEPVASPAAPAG